MRSTVAPLVVLGSLVGVVYGQTALIINTPTPPPVQCQPTLITWGGGTPPYFITLVDPDDKTNILVDFGQLSNTSLTWTDPFPAGQNLLLTIKDSTGAPQSSAPFSVASGGSASCVSSSSAPPQSATSGGSSPSAPLSTSTIPVVSTPSASLVSTPVTTLSATSTKPVSSATLVSSVRSGSASASAPSGSASTTPNGATNNGVALAAVVGAVFAALF